MENNQIRVVINPDGLSCKECNRLGEKPARHSFYSEYSEKDYWDYVSKDENWEEAESKLRTFSIENFTSCGNSVLLQLDLDGIACEQLSEPGSIHTAEIISEGKVKIIE